MKESRKRRLNTKTQIICAWCGPLAAILLFAGMIIMGFIPPTLPSADAAQIVAIYQGNTTAIRIGSIMILTAGALFVPWLAAIAVQMKRIEGDAPVLTLVQFSAGTVNTLFFAIPAILFAAAAFRPDRSADVIYLLDDLGWFFFIIPFCMATAQSFAIGFAIFSDDLDEPIFPRWAAYVNFLFGLLSIPACLLAFFKIGPFAWNGLFSFWIPAALFGAWLFVMAICVHKAATQQAIDSVGI